MIPFISSNSNGHKNLEKPRNLVLSIITAKTTSNAGYDCIFWLFAPSFLWESAFVAVYLKDYSTSVLSSPIITRLISVTMLSLSPAITLRLIPRLNRLVSRLYNRFDNRMDVCLHDAAGCTTGCTIEQPFVQPTWQPVGCLYTRYNLLSNWLWPVVSCIQTFKRLSNRFDDRFDNRLYRVNRA